MKLCHQKFCLLNNFLNIHKKIEIALVILMINFIFETKLKNKIKLLFK